MYGLFESDALLDTNVRSISFTKQSGTRVAAKIPHFWNSMGK